MSVSVKYAILDTDFVSKANIIKNHDSVLADEVLSFPNYCFLCHKKMKDVRMAGALIKSLYDDGMIEKNIYDRCKERVDKMIADLSKREKNVQHLEMTFSRDTVKRQKR